MTPEETQKLIDHLDESRTGRPSPSHEQPIDQDPDAAQEWYYLNLAVDAVRNSGLHEQVAFIKENLRKEQNAPAKPAYTEEYIAVPANQAIRMVQQSLPELSSARSADTACAPPPLSS